MARWGSMVVKLFGVNTVCAVFDKAGALRRDRNTHTGSFLEFALISFWKTEGSRASNLPTLEVASVKLFNVVDFPLDGYVPLA